MLRSIPFSLFFYCHDRRALLLPQNASTHMLRPCEEAPSVPTAFSKMPFSTQRFPYSILSAQPERIQMDSIYSAYAPAGAPCATQCPGDGGEEVSTKFAFTAKKHKGMKSVVKYNRDESEVKLKMKWCGSDGSGGASINFH